MGVVIDSHLHIFPDPAAALLARVPGPVPGLVSSLRRSLRKHTAGLRRGLHSLQPHLRSVPENVRRKLDVLAYTAVFPSMLVEATPEDLVETLDRNAVDYALAIASPPHADNDFVFAACERHAKLLPVVYFPPSSEGPERAAAGLTEAARRGAKALKIHPAYDGLDSASEHYRALLKVADEEGLPVILHTGCMHMGLVYKVPEMGHAERFKDWFEEFPNVRFVLAHMNLHYPDVALNLAENFSNLYLETSWQPESVIGRAVARVGAERVLFGSDWPLLGENVDVGLKRVRDCAREGILTEKQAELVLGESARALFRL